MKIVDPHIIYYNKFVEHIKHALFKNFAIHLVSFGFCSSCFAFIEQS